MNIRPINIHNLDMECTYQSQLIVEAVEKAANAVALFLQAELEYDNDKSYQELEVRRNPKSFGLEKETEGAIKALVHDRTTETRKAVVEAEKEKYAAIQYKEAVLARAAELKNLINLYLNDYYVRKESLRIEEASQEVVMGIQEEAHNEDLTARLADRKRVLDSIGGGQKLKKGLIKKE